MFGVGAWPRERAASIGRIHSASSFWRLLAMLLVKVGEVGGLRSNHLVYHEGCKMVEMLTSDNCLLIIPGRELYGTV